MRSPDGIEYRNGGVFREIVEPERLVYTFAWEDENGRPGHETQVVLAFAERDGGTEMTFRQGVFPFIRACPQLIAWPEGA